MNQYFLAGDRRIGDPVAHFQFVDAVSDFFAAHHGLSDAAVVAGDFNIAPEDADVHDPDAWRGKVLFSEAEKAALEKLLALA